jgi:hypothetical protein
MKFQTSPFDLKSDYSRSGPMRIKICLSVVMMLLFAVPSFSMERFEIITTEELEGMLEARELGTTDFVLVNTLDEIIYRNSSIPGSINIPWSRVKETIDRAGEDKDRLLVLY